MFEPEQPNNNVLHKDQILKSLSDIILSMSSTTDEGRHVILGKGCQKQCIEMGKLAFDILSRHVERGDAVLVEMLSNQLARYQHDTTTGIVEKFLSSGTPIPSKERDLLLDFLDLVGGPGEFSLENDSSASIANKWRKIAAALVSFYRNLYKKSQPNR